MNDLSNVKKMYINYINNVIRNKKISHAYLIELDNYESDIVYVYNFIKMILCNLEYDELDKSNNKIIKLIDDGNYPDITVISTDNTVIKKTDILDLQKEFSNKSLYDNKKIYIIYSAEKLNNYSANTILKFLEEPEDNIIAFLLTDNRFNILDTIISRCQILSLKEESYKYQLNNDTLDFLDYLLNPNNFFINYNDLVKNKYSDKFIMKDILIESENIIISYLSKSDDRLNDIFGNILSDELIRIVSVIEAYLAQLKYNVNYKLWLNSFFSSLLGG